MKTDLVTKAFLETTKNTERERCTTITVGSTMENGEMICNMGMGSYMTVMMRLYTRAIGKMKNLMEKESCIMRSQSQRMSLHMRISIRCMTAGRSMKANFRIM